MPRTRSRGQGVGDYFKGFLMYVNQGHGKGGGMGRFGGTVTHSNMVLGTKISRHFFPFSSEKGVTRGRHPTRGFFGRSSIFINYSFL